MFVGFLVIHKFLCFLLYLAGYAARTLPCLAGLLLLRHREYTCCVTIFVYNELKYTDENSQRSVAYFRVFNRKNVFYEDSNLTSSFLILGRSR